MKGPSCQTRLLLAASVATFLIALDSSILYVAFPAICGSFPQLSTAQLSWVINAYSISLASMLVPAGYFADALGRKRVFLTGLMVFAAASVSCAAATSAAALIASRVLQALGGALVLPSSLATIVAYFSGRERMIAIGKWSAVGGVAAAIGPPVGAAVLHFGSWRILFLINAPICVMGFVLALRAFDNCQRSKLARSFATVMPPVATGIGLIASGMLSTQSLLLAAGAVVLLISAWAISRQPSLHPVLGQLDVLSAAAATMCFGAAFGSMFITYSLTLVHRFGISVPLAGLMLTPIPLLSVPVANRAGRLGARISLRLLICSGALSLGAGAWIFSFALAQERLSAGVWFLTTLLSAAGLGLCFPLLSIIAVRSVLPEYFAISSGVNQACRQMGTVLGVAGASMLLTGFSPATFGRAMTLLTTLSAATMLSLCGPAMLSKARKEAA